MKDRVKKIVNYFTPFEWVLWLGGAAVIIGGFLVGEEKNWFSLASSLFGISCIIFNAKGSVWGQIIAVPFALFYAYLSYTKAYYGEMIIYLALMTPIHVASIISWLRNMNKSAEHLEVKINRISAVEYSISGVCAIGLTFAFYFLLKVLGTDNLEVSTISLITSLAAAYLMLRRCEYFAICFILNDVILIILWSLKLSVDGLSVLPSVLSFIIFLANDAYSFINWKRIKHRQKAQIAQN